MTNQEMKTITEAMVTKQTWIRKELNDFLEFWAATTQDKISGHDKFVLYEYGNGEGNRRLFLVRGRTEVNGDTDTGYEWKNWDNYLDLDTQPIAKIRKIISHINSGVVKYFKNIQANIDEIDRSGYDLRDTIETLKWRPKNQKK